MAYIVNDGGRFRLCRSERTPAGSRRIVLAYLGSAPRCRTLPGAIAYWRAFLKVAQATCKTEVEQRDGQRLKTRAWKRAAARCARARRRIAAILPYA